MYFAVKHIHLTAIVISLSLFLLRFFWQVRGSALLEKKWVKITPHVVDTVLLASALTLCVLINQYPFVDLWLTEKIMGLVFYIALGMYALKLGKTPMLRWLGFFGALAWLVFIAKVAVFKQPLLLG